MCFTRKMMYEWTASTAYVVGAADTDPTVRHDSAANAARESARDLMRDTSWKGEGAGF
jgi:hypothetical protein